MSVNTVASLLPLLRNRVSKNDTFVSMGASHESEDGHLPE